MGVGSAEGQVAWIEGHLLTTPHPPPLKLSWEKTQALKFYSRKVGV